LPDAYGWWQDARHTPWRTARLFGRGRGEALAECRAHRVPADTVRAARLGCASGSTSLARSPARCRLRAISRHAETLSQLHEARRIEDSKTTHAIVGKYPRPTSAGICGLFHAAGMSVDLRQYPCGEELTTNMLSDMDRWIMRQFNETAPAVEDQPSIDRPARRITRAARSKPCTGGKTRSLARSNPVDRHGRFPDTSCPRFSTHRAGEGQSAVAFLTVVGLGAVSFVKSLAAKGWRIACQQAFLGQRSADPIRLESVEGCMDAPSLIPAPRCLRALRIANGLNVRQIVDEVCASLARRSSNSASIRHRRAPLPGGNGPTVEMLRARS